MYFKTELKMYQDIVNKELEKYIRKNFYTYKDFICAPLQSSPPRQEMAQERRHD